MSLTGSLYVGTSGLQTNQNALNTTAHNMSNVDTRGYVRQQVLLGTKLYNTISINTSSVANQQIGLGVSYSSVRQVRDYFLDQTYRKESGRSAFYSASSEAMSEVENLLNEMDGASFEEALSNLWTAVQELAKDPSSAITQGTLVQTASAFVERAGAVYSGLTSYQNNLNAKVKTQVDSLNDYANQLQSLNDSIRSIEVGGIEAPNDLKDQRNTILDKMSALGNITYSTDLDGSVSVQLEGVDLVTRSNVYEVGLYQDNATGFYIPFWTQNATYTTDSLGNRTYNITGAAVFDLNKKISADLNTDIGSIKALLLARGDKQANYTDINSGKYDTDISQSVMMNMQAEFDQLIHNVTTAVNGVIAAASNSTTGYLCNKDGSPIQIFQKIASAGYTETPSGSGIWVYNAEDATDEDTLYTTKNLKINPELMQNSSMLGFIKSDKSVDYDTAKKLKEAFLAENYTLNPNVQTKTNFVSYYTDLVSQVANSGSALKNMLANQESTVEGVSAAREEIIGVAADEEMTNMVRFQNAYNASSRFINVIDQMMETIINSMGR